MLGYSQMNSFDFKISSLGNTLGVTAGEFAALIGSLGVSAGKVIYKWMPRMRVDLNIKQNKISDIDSGDMGWPFWLPTKFAARCWFTKVGCLTIKVGPGCHTGGTIGQVSCACA